MYNTPGKKCSSIIVICVERLLYIAMIGIKNLSMHSKHARALSNWRIHSIMFGNDPNSQGYSWCRTHAKVKNLKYQPRLSERNILPEAH